MRFPIRDRCILPLRQTVKIGGVNFKAYRVEHSIRALAVGYRVSVKAASFFYLPDVAKLPNRLESLRGVGVYIGDGAILDGPAYLARAGQRYVVRAERSEWGEWQEVRR